MALIGDIPSAFPEISPETRCHDTDRSRCHSATSQKPATAETGPPNDGSTFAYYHDLQYEEIDDIFKRTYPTSSSGLSRKCDKSCCKVGRNSGRFRSFVRAKMNFVDVSRIRPSTSKKMCMTTRLVGEDCKPLLIRGSDDLMFPINDDVTNDLLMTSRHKNGPGQERGRCRRFLDGLARTFCLPLLG